MFEDLIAFKQKSKLKITHERNLSPFWLLLICLNVGICVVSLLRKYPVWCEKQNDHYHQMQPLCYSNINCSCWTGLSCTANSSSFICTDMQPMRYDFPTAVLPPIITINKRPVCEWMGSLPSVLKNSPGCMIYWVLSPSGKIVLFVTWNNWDETHCRVHHSHCI